MRKGFNGIMLSTLLSAFLAGNVRQALLDLILIIPVVLLSLSLHEAAHAFVAYKMGDRTAFNLGRVTINPIKHLDPIGSLVMLVVGYGWAKPVPINPRNFRDPKKGMALTAIAGPVTNLLLGTVGVLCHVLLIFIARATDLMLFIDPNTYYQLSENVTLVNAFLLLMRFFTYFAYMNFVLAIFNLIPVPPFDGSRFFSMFLPTRWYFAIMRYERYYLIIVIAISIVCSRVFHFSPFGALGELLADGVMSLFFRIFMGA